MALHVPILLTGGNGLLGRAFRVALSRRGWRCTAPFRRRCDIGSPSEIRRVLDEQSPEIVINCAAYTNMDRCEYEADHAKAVNAEAVADLAAAVAERGAKLVHISCADVFSGTCAIPLREDNRPVPLSAYGRSKLLGEILLRKADPSGWLLIRTGWLFGDGACFPTSVVNYARVQGSVKAICDQVGSPSYALDVANAVIDLIELEACGVWHVANSGTATWFDLAQATLEGTRVDARLQAITTDTWQHLYLNAARRPMFSVLDSSAFGEVASKSMRHWREALDEHCSLLRLQVMAES